MAGTTMDENVWIRGYFHYCLNSDDVGDHEIYEADVAPYGSFHDRACELYQQLVGIKQINNIA